MVPGDASTDLQPRFAPTLEPSRFELLVTEGPDAGARFTIDASDPSAVLIGTGPACAFRLTDREVSRRHCAVEAAGRRLRVRDLGSSNGTFADGVAIVEALLRGDETVRLGRTAIHVAPREDGAPPALPITDRFGRVFGVSTEMRRLYALCERLAASQVPVVIEGETGTGKEALAEALHEQGARAAGPFMVFDCTAVAPSLVESELFGHERGAFTGASSARKGIFELADGGTLLIDEIGDLDPTLQPKLLRAIERSEIRRIGGARPVRVDVRILAATRRDLDREVQAGRFRDDLFHRLAVARIELPPLRRRAGDVPLLARAFARQLGAEGNAVPAELLARWNDHAWPGNVRELRNAVARWLALGDLAPPIGGALRDPEPESPASGEGASAFAAILAQRLPLIQARAKVVDAFEREYIDDVLRAHGGSVARASAASGIARRHFQRLKARTHR